ncbi:MAG: RNA polymerase sigma factor [Oscillospiraceae bacterium]|jgi:RNA polymerase sigma factor (sigma-70 family)
MLNQQATLFDALYEEHAGRLYAYFSVAFGPDEADDLLQRLFLSVWNSMNRPGFLQPDHWRAWLFRAAVNLKNDVLRAGRRCRELPLEEYDQPVQRDDGEALAVQEAFSRLAPHEQDLLLWKNMGLSSAEMAEILGVSASAVRSRYQTAKKWFRKYLEECGVDCGG